MDSVKAGFEFLYCCPWTVRWLVSIEAQHAPHKVISTKIYLALGWCSVWINGKVKWMFFDYHIVRLEELWGRLGGGDMDKIYRWIFVSRQFKGSHPSRIFQQSTVSIKGYSIPIDCNKSIKPITNRNFIMLPIAKCFNLAPGGNYSLWCLNLLCTSAGCSPRTCMEISWPSSENLQIVFPVIPSPPGW